MCPDACGEGEQSLADPGPDAVGDVSAVVLQGELSLGRVVDRFDPLAHATEAAEPWLLALAVWADERRIEGGDSLLELLAGEALVSGDDLPTLKEAFLACSFEHRRGDLALPLVCWGRREVDGHPVRGAQQVQPQPPEVAAVAGAIPVGGPASELAALGGLPGGTARHRRGVEQPEPVVEGRRDPGELVDDQADPWRERADALVVARLLGDVGEQVSQPLAGKTQKPPLGVAVEHDLRDRKRNELWAALAHELTGRGLPCPQLVVSDGAPGLITTIKQCWPGADRQRCTAHRLRNLLAKLPVAERERMRAAYWKVLDEAQSITDGERGMRALIAQLTDSG